MREDEDALALAWLVERAIIVAVTVVVVMACVTTAVLFWWPLVWIVLQYWRG